MTTPRSCARAGDDGEPRARASTARRPRSTSGTSSRSREGDGGADPRAPRRARVRAGRLRGRAPFAFTDADPARAGARVERRGDRARARRRLRRRRPRRRSRGAARARGSSSRGTRDNLAAALAGGVCLTWDGRGSRGSPTDLPAVPIALVPDTSVVDRRARAPRCRETVAARRRGAHRRPRRAARRCARGRRSPSCSPRRSTTACTSRTAPPTRRCSAAVRERLPGRRARRRRSRAPGPTVIVWARPEARGRRARASSPPRHPEVRVLPLAVSASRSSTP